MRSSRRETIFRVLLFAVCVATATGGQAGDPPRGSTFEDFDCGYRDGESWQQELQGAVDRGEIADPLTRAPNASRSASTAIATATASSISRPLSVGGQPEPGRSRRGHDRERV